MNANNPGKGLDVKELFKIIDKKSTAERKK